MARFLQSVGKRIVPVHPRAETVHGETGYATLADIPFEVDVVDVFVNSRRAGEIADQALLHEGARRVVPARRDRRGGGGPGARRGPDDGDGPLPGDRVAPHGAVADATADRAFRAHHLRWWGERRGHPAAGIGVRKDFALRDGRRIGVVSHRDGKLSLIISKTDDPDAAWPSCR